MSTSGNNSKPKVTLTMTDIEEKLMFKKSKKCENSKKRYCAPYDTNFNLQTQFTKK